MQSSRLEPETLAKHFVMYYVHFLDTFVSVVRIKCAFCAKELVTYRNSNGDYLEPCRQPTRSLSIVFLFRVIKHRLSYQPLRY